MTDSTTSKIGPLVSEIPLTGYADALSVRAGGRIAFKVSSRLASSYHAELVRVICGDPNPAGPGRIEEAVPAAFAGDYPSRAQEICAGSYTIVEGLEQLGPLRQFTLRATLWPTTPEKGPQGVVTLAGVEGERIALGLDAVGRAAIWGEGPEPLLLSAEPLRARHWVSLEAVVDLDKGSLALSVVPGDRQSAAGLSLPGVLTPASLTVAAFDGPGCEGFYNGKIEAPALLGGLGDEAAPLLQLDFARAIESQRIEDVGPHGFSGHLVNLPTRAVTGALWDGSEMCWRHAPAHYAAIHFHDDDLADCGWESDFHFDVPEDLPSGLYAAKLTGGGVVDRIPFVVPPPRGRRTADLCVVMSTFTYLIYGNNARIDFSDKLRQRTADWGGCAWNPADHPELGLSTYNCHSDGSGIGYASPLRPLLTLRPDFLSILDAKGSGLRHLPADTHILAWLAAKGIACDLVSDHELHAEGAAALEGYRAVLTSSHPEYHTRESLDAFLAYREGGGRLAYLGGNGFYWQVVQQPEPPEEGGTGALEIRRTEGGIRAWEAQPGEYYHAFDGSYGGLWRRKGRPPQQLVGIGFSAQGLFEGAPYHRSTASFEPRFAWLFDGIEGEVLGDFGLSGGGAAGYELDRLEPGLGSPPEALVLASSSGHQAHFTPVYEELLTHVSTVFGQRPEELVRADMIYWETPSGGAVFAAGSITFCGALPYANFENDASRLLENLLAGWLGAEA